ARARFTGLNFLRRCFHISWFVEEEILRERIFVPPLVCGRLFLTKVPAKPTIHETTHTGLVGEDNPPPPLPVNV
ncbi:MAG: hypothetical protein ACREBC_00205, partial [Pyrinomonadaceae bacterium]